MLPLADCSALAPPWLCQHRDVLLYLAPSVALACVIRLLVRVHPLFFLLTVAGTLCHELAHYAVGLLAGAQPSRLTIVPRRVGRDWELGSVTFANLRWYNAAPAALAPLLVILLPFVAAWWRTAPGWIFGPLDLALAFALAPQFLSFWPSRVDWRLAWHSWPYLVAIVSAGALLYGDQHGLFQFVKTCTHGECGP